MSAHAAHSLKQRKSGCSRPTRTRHADCRACMQEETIINTSAAEEGGLYLTAEGYNASATTLRLLKEMLSNWSKQHHVDDPDFDFMRRPAWRGLLMALFITVILVGLVGNTIVVFVVVKNRNMQNVTNIFIANLALSDIGLCLLSLPVQLYYQLTDHWIFGEIMCKIIFAAFAVPMYASTLTIFLIALDRYGLILYPLRARMSVRTALSLIAVIVFISMLFSIPVVVFTSEQTVSQPDLRIHRSYCIEKWPTEIGRKIYSASMFLLQFCLPICMTALLYYKIYCRLKHRPSHRSSNNADRKQKTNKVLFAIVSLFVICWLPWNMFSLITELDRTIVKGAHFKFVDLLLKLFAMSSACINPFLYCWLNDNFRKELDQIAIKMKIYRREEPTVRSPAAVPMLSGIRDTENNGGQLYRAVSTQVIPGNVSLTSRLSITRMSTTRYSTCSALDLATSSALLQHPHSRRSSTAMPRPNGPISPQQQHTKEFGNFLTVPV